MSARLVIAYWRLIRLGVHLLALPLFVIDPDWRKENTMSTPALLILFGLMAIIASLALPGAAILFWVGVILLVVGLVTAVAGRRF
jgi:membrane-bound ClpP family serine protease